MVRVSRGKGQVTIVDITDSKQLTGYIASNLQRQIIYDPMKEALTPDFTKTPMVLSAELYITGRIENIIKQAESIEWYEQINSIGDMIKISPNATYDINNEHLTIKQNVLGSGNISRTYQAHVTYIDPDTKQEHFLKIDIELVKVSNGADGSDGKDGRDGIPGKDGVGIQDTTVTYALSPSEKNPPSEGWSSQVPTLTKGNFLWTRTVWHYTDNTDETGYAVAYISKDGNDGNDGIPGKDGVGIKDTVIQYVSSSDGDTPPTNGWTTQVPNVSKGEYIWTKTTWYYSDNTNETGYSVAYIGTDGSDGKDGRDGKQGIPAVNLAIITPKGDTIRNHNGTLTAQANLFIGGDKVNPTYNWYRLSPRHSGDSLSGTGWQPLSEKSDTLTVDSVMIDSTGVFMVIVEYQGKTYRATTTFTDIVDLYDIEIIGANMFRNGKGETTLTAKIYQSGREIDSSNNSGYTYTWYGYNYQGNLINSFTRTGKTITVKSSEVDHVLNLMIKVEE